MGLDFISALTEKTEATIRVSFDENQEGDCLAMNQTPTRVGRNESWDSGLPVMKRLALRRR